MGPSISPSAIGVFGTDLRVYDLITQRHRSVKRRRLFSVCLRPTEQRRLTDSGYGPFRSADIPVCRFADIPVGCAVPRPDILRTALRPGRYENLRNGRFGNLRYVAWPRSGGDQMDRRGDGAARSIPENGPALLEEV